MADPPRRYTRDEMQEILRRALDRQARDQREISHDELVDAAREVGIDTNAIEDAARELHTSHAVDDAEAQRTQRRRLGLYRHAAIFFIVNTALAALDLLTTGGKWWFAIAILWGIGVALHALGVFMPRQEAPEERARRLEAEARRAAAKAERDARRARKLARREAKKARADAIQKGAEQFESAVEQGVALLLNGLAKQVQRGVDHVRNETLGPPLRELPRPDARDDARLRSAGRDRVAPPPSLVRIDVGKAEQERHEQEELEIERELERLKRSKR
jgi:hypothetical protein